MNQQSLDFYLNETDGHAHVQLIEDHTALCSVQGDPVEPTLKEYFSGLFTTGYWPDRWHCGSWSELDGWIHIISDLAIFLAYFSIPILLLLFMNKMSGIKKYRAFFILFSLFIFSCGLTHLIEVVIFWQPIYRFSGFFKILTAIISCVTVVALIKDAPLISWLSSEKNLEREKREKQDIRNQRDTFLKYAPCAIAVFNKEMLYVEVNDRWCADYGLEREDILGRSHYEVFPEVLQISNWLDDHQSVLAGQSVIKEKDVLKSRNGEVTYIKYRLEPWRNHDGEVGGIIMYTEDITTTVQMQSELIKKQAHLQAIFDHSAMGICLADEAGKPFIVNDRMCEIVGYSRDELTAMTFDQFTHPEDVAKDVQLFERLKRNEFEHYCINKRYVSKEGEISHVILNVSMVTEPETGARHALALIQDVTPRVEADQRSQEVTKMLRDFSLMMDETWQVAQMGSLQLDLSSKTVIFSNSVCEILEIAGQEVISLDDLIGIFHKQDRARIREVLDLSLIDRKGWDIDLRIQREDNDEKWIRFIGHPIVADGEMVRVEGLIKDVDQIKKMNLELAELNARLEYVVGERTEELAMLNRELEAFAYSVSHDLRAPLRAIEGFAAAFMEDYRESLDRYGLHYMDRINYNTCRMGKLIDDLLEFSRSTKAIAICENFDLKATIKKLIKDMDLPKSVNVELINLDQVYGDHSMLTQVFQNLLSNAVKYSSLEENPRITIEQKCVRDGVEISFADNGVGFDMKMKNQLFKIFQRLHPEGKFEGTGIGLALSKRILDRHHGNIYANGEVGVGAEFTVFLPVGGNVQSAVGKRLSPYEMV